MKRDALGYYEILNVDYYTDIDVIKSNYRELAKFWHPDINKSDEAVEKFQHISEAWEYLSDESKRIDYDLLSAVYDKDNYPDLDNMVPFISNNPDIRAIKAKRVRAMIAKYKIYNKVEVCDYKQALRLHMKSAIENWLLGWWHPQALLNNISALQINWKKPISEEDSLRVLVHNMVAYRKKGQQDLAVASAVRALEYADDEFKEILQKYIKEQNIKVSRPMKWNMQNLRLVQLIMPLILVVLVLFPFGTNYVTEGEIWNLFSKKNEINYYQEVNFGNDSTGVDDMVVAKILNIPVDKRDVRYLYHLVKDVDVMYGPGENFDVLKKLTTNTTVRLTGKSPDNKWYRIMIDNGEMGFVRTDTLKQGIGLEIPYGSKIFEE